MGFGKKREVLYALKPDVAVIPECSQDAAKVCSDDGYPTCCARELFQLGELGIR